MFPKKKRIKDRDLLLKINKMPCIICKTSPSDSAHILSKGSGGDDVPWNIIPFCRKHHIEQHQYGWFKMCERNPFLRQELYQRGFYFDGFKKLRKER
jgi:hypothetical protein